MPAMVGYLNHWATAALDHLEDNIHRVIADIRPQMLEKVIENWTTSELAVAVLCQKSYLKSTRGLLATDHVILNNGQVTWTTPELAPPLLTTTPRQRKDISALDRFNVHHCPTRRVFSGTGLELLSELKITPY
ncbi:uncharacterized protein TNCV_1070331 [Trichonephila clavipes]|nr:uncharacterized protein TNCV_1070331 [Trichonephila clavipes]